MTTSVLGKTARFMDAVDDLSRKIRNGVRGTPMAIKGFNTVGALLIFTALFAAVVGALILKLPSKYRLEKYGVPIEAIVISKNREDHMSVIFRYEVEGQTYTALGRGAEVKGGFDSISANEVVEALYDPYNRENATLGDPREQLLSSLAGTVFISLIPTVFFIAYRIRARRNCQTVK